MTSPSAPPRLPRWLLERALPHDVRSDVAGDLEEMFHRRCASDGAGAARRWFWRQALSFSRHFIAERIRERWTHRDMGTRFSGMDFRLALRMLVRNPALTVIAVIGLAVGIMISAGAFAILYTLVDPALPLDEGDRIVAIQTWDSAKNRAERRVLHDFVAWREELTSVTDVGAFRQVSRNLIAPGAQPETLAVAEMSASGFRVARVAPLLGRHLLDEDERAGAQPVVVIGYDVWRTRFAADPAIVGRVVQLGDAPHVIVGVMPAGFAFPVNHRVWVPLRLDPNDYPRLGGPALTVFARLAPGASLERASVEVATFSRRTADAHPATHDKLRADVVPYTFPFFDIDDPAARWLVHLMQALITLLLVIVCVNVAILVYARTAMRHGEIAVRTALGASRGRIIGQLFVEALVLAAVAAVVGLAFTAFALGQVNVAMAQLFAGLPFWWRFEVSPGVVVYVFGLAVLIAAIVGALPAVKATGKRVQLGLQRISAGGGSGMQLGRTWTLLIVVQVGVAVALLPAAVFHAWDSLTQATAHPGFNADEFLTTQLVMDRAASGAAVRGDERADQARFARAQAELLRRLSEESAVAQVTTSSSLPGGEATVWIEAEGVAVPAGAAQQQGWVVAGTRAGHEVRFNRVDLRFFDVFDVPLLAGRTLTTSDTAAAAHTIVVNESFVRNVLGGNDPLGRRVRYVGASGDAQPGEVPLGPWHEIVGVVADFPVHLVEGDLAAAKMYHAVPPEALAGGMLAMQLRGGDPTAFAGRLREISAAVDPNLQLRNIANLGTVLRQEQKMMQVIATVLVVLTSAVLLLSAAGIYALMSFTVSQRRREIGIRSALGADARHIVASIFSRAAWQLALGALLGVAVAALLEVATDGSLMKGQGLVVLPIVAGIIAAVGLLAAFGPAKRGLRIHPTEALREQ